MPTSPSDWASLRQGVQGMRQAGREQMERGLLGQATEMINQPGGGDFKGMMGLAQQSPNPMAFMQNMGQMFQMKSGMEQREVLSKAGNALIQMYSDNKFTKEELIQVSRATGLNPQQITVLAQQIIDMGAVGQPPEPEPFTLAQNAKRFVGGQEIASNPGPVNTQTNITIPAGFKPVNDESGSIIGMEMIPGGPADIANRKLKTEEEAIKTGKQDALTLEFSTAKAKQNRLSGQLQNAFDNANVFTTGIWGTGAGLLPGTKAFTLKQTVDTINANLAFDRLQEMRNASVTGGALGQVSERELKLLERAVASLNNSQNEEDFKKNIGIVQRHYNNWYNNYTKMTQKKAATLDMKPDFFKTLDKGNQGTDLPPVSTQSEFDALPSGTIYLENGQQYQKP